MLGRGTTRIPSLCWGALDLFIRRKQPQVVSLISLLVRWHSQSKVEVVGETKFDLRRNETKAAVSYWDEDAVNKAHVMA